MISKEKSVIKQIIFAYELKSGYCVTETLESKEEKYLIKKSSIANVRFLKINDKWFIIFNIMGLQNVIKCCILSIGSVRLAERYALRVVGDTHREYRLLKISRPPGRPLLSMVTRVVFLFIYHYVSLNYI